VGGQKIARVGSRGKGDEVSRDKTRGKKAGDALGTVSAKVASDKGESPSGEKLEGKNTSGSLNGKIKKRWTLRSFAPTIAL